MDEEFKFWYETNMISLLYNIEPQWKKQVKKLHQLWEDAGRLIDQEKFAASFAKSCAQLELPADMYDFKSAFIKANGEWKHELMLRVADFIVSSCGRQDHAVFLHNGHIKVDTTKCPSFYDPTMDEQFKFWYSTWIYSLLPEMEPDKQKQVINLHLLWEEVDKLIDKPELVRSIINDCQRDNLQLPYVDYDYDSAFAMALNEWKPELMVRVADDIVFTYDNDLPEELAFVNEKKLTYCEDGCIKVDITKCPSFYEHVLAEEVKFLHI